MSGLRVLVVEDERIISLAMTMLLRGLGHKVLACVPSGEEALRAVAAHKPDLVFMDIRLEGELDGIATAQALRLLDGAPPVAFTTAYTDTDTKERALAAKPLAFLPKPVSQQDIKNLVCSLCAPEP